MRTFQASDQKVSVLICESKKSVFIAKAADIARMTLICRTAHFHRVICSEFPAISSTVILTACVLVRPISTVRRTVAEQFLLDTVAVAAR